MGTFKQLQERIDKDYQEIVSRYLQLEKIDIIDNAYKIASIQNFKQSLTFLVDELEDDNEIYFDLLEIEENIYDFLGNKWFYASLTDCGNVLDTIRYLLETKRSNKNGL